MDEFDLLGIDRKKHRISTAILLVALLALCVPIAIFFSFPVIAVPFIIAIAFYFSPKYNLDRIKSREVENSFILSMLISSYAYIYRDIYNSIVASLSSMNSMLSRELRKISWNYLVFNPKKNFRETLMESKTIKGIDPSLPEVISLIATAINERKYDVGESVKKPLSYHATSLFTSLIERARKAVNPIRIVFSVLVVFPVFLLILLPLGALFLPETMNVINMFVLFVIIIPSTAFLALEWYSTYLPSKPEYSKISDLKIPLALAFLLFFAIFIFSLFSPSIMIVVLFLLGALLFFGYVYVFYREKYASLLSNYSMMSRISQFFLVMAKTLARGVPFERAAMEAESKEKIDVGAKYFHFGRDQLSFSTLFSSYAAFMQVLKEAAKKNISAEISDVVTHFFKLKDEMEEKIKFINEETMHTARILLVLVIPLIAAVSSAFSDSLEKMITAFSFENVAFFSISQQAFPLTLVLALYTLLMAIILTLFLSNLEGIRDPLYVFYESSKNIALAFSAFAVSYFISLYFINLFLPG